MGDSRAAPDETGADLCDGRPKAGGSCRRSSGETPEFPTRVRTGSGSRPVGSGSSAGIAGEAGSGEVHRALGRRTRRGECWRFGGQSEVLEDLADHCLVLDEGQQATGTQATRAGQGFNLEDAPQELVPKVVPTTARRLSRSVGNAAETSPAPPGDRGKGAGRWQRWWCVGFRVWCGRRCWFQSRRLVRTPRQRQRWRCVRHGSGHT